MIIIILEYFTYLWLLECHTSKPCDYALEIRYALEFYVYQKNKTRFDF